MKLNLNMKKRMSEVKSYVFPEGGSFSGNGMEGMLLGSMMNGGMNGGGMWNNPIWAIVFLAALRNGGLFGNDGCNGYHSQLSQIQDTLNTNQGNSLLMDAIKGNATAIGQLSQAINCNQNAVTAAINAVQGAICNVGNQVGMGTAQVINAVQAGDTSVISAIKDCCCQTQQNIIKMGYDNQISNLQQSQLISNGFSQVGYAAAENACSIRQNATDNANRIIAKIDAVQDEAKNNEIASLRAALATANSRAERAAELAPIFKALEEIKGKQPNTVPVPWPQLTAIPTNQLYGLGVYANGQWS